MDIGNFSREDLYSINIHDLRKMGQQIGVKSPSSLNKDDLIENIYAIVTGMQLPYKQKDRRGRPSKTTIANDILEDMRSLTSFGSAQSSLSFGHVASQGSEMYVTGNISKKLIKRGTFMKTKQAGKVCKFPYGKSDEDAYVGNELIMDYNLRDFDVLEYIVADPNAHFKEVSNILSVNGKKVSDEEVYFNRLERVPCREEFQMAINGKKENIKFGTRVLIYDDVSFNNTSVCDKYIESLKTLNNANIVRLCLDKQEVVSDTSNNVHTFSSLVVDNPIVSLDACNNALLKAKIEASLGGNIVIVVDNFEALIKTFKASYADNAQMYIKRFLFTANAYSNNSSITIVGLLPLRAKKEQWAIKDYIEYFDGQF